VAIVAVALSATAAPLRRASAFAAAGIPERLSDREFWRLSADLSEPNGAFQSDNLVSNERPFQTVVPDLLRRRGRGAYVGVAPDQNFTYIAALDPKIAFIVDIRRGNLQEQLMYKAIIELSADRADFYARLFSRKRPDGLGPLSSVQEIVTAFAGVAPGEALYKENLKAIDDQLTKRHGFPLGEDDRAGIEYIYGRFFTFGPSITYRSTSVGSGRNSGGGMPSYAELLMQSDAEGQHRSYLANEGNFQTLKSLESRNLLVPVVGDFAGPKALRAIGRYLAEGGTTVTAYYVSNVEQYLFQNGVWQNFYRNVATLPLDESSVFIRSTGGVTVLDPIRTMVRDVAEGKVQTYQDVRARTSR
jgi:hypothetical protein